MNQQDQQAIDDLFRHLYQTAEQSGPRDEPAETLTSIFDGAGGLFDDGGVF